MDNPPAICAECLEQARLLGMSAERELSLRAQRAVMQATNNELCRQLTEAYDPVPAADTTAQLRVAKIEPGAGPMDPILPAKSYNPEDLRALYDGN